MSLNQDIQISPTRLRMVVEAIEAVGGDADAAMSQAIQRTARGVRTVMVRATAQDLSIRQRALYRQNGGDQAFQERFARSGRHVVEGHLSVEGLRLPLAEFKPSPIWKKTRRKRGRQVIRGRRHAGASYRIGAQGRKRVATLFVVEFKNSGKRRVYARTGKGRKLSGDGVQERFGPSVPHATGNRPEVQALIAGGAADRFAKEANSQVERYIGRGRSRA